jgi:hypothetical protein
MAEPPPDRVTAVARVALSHGGAGDGCPAYTALLRRALAEEPPPYGEESYERIFRAAAAEGQWLAISLIANAEREGDGATRLWSLAACSPEGEEQLLLKRHAVDESSHSLAYLALLDLAFPGAVAPEFRRQLDQLSPGYAMARPLAAREGSPYARVPSIDDYIQMNIAEIRTTLHHLMQREAIAIHCPRENLPRVLKILNSLLRDELSHVAYTAVLIDEKARAAEPEAVQALFTRRVRDFNDITRRELGQRKFD